MVDRTSAQPSGYWRGMQNLHSLVPVHTMH